MIGDTTEEESTDHDCVLNRPNFAPLSAKE
jgi:hypothetical protein